MLIPSEFFVDLLQKKMSPIHYARIAAIRVLTTLIMIVIVMMTTIAIEVAILGRNWFWNDDKIDVWPVQTKLCRMTAINVYIYCLYWPSN